MSDPCTGDLHTRCPGHPCNAITHRMAELGAQATARSKARKRFSVSRRRQPKVLPGDTGWIQGELPASDVCHETSS
jgi:hypothetical protein